MQPLDHDRDQFRRRSEGFGQHRTVMSACRDLRRDVGSHVVSGGEERGNHDDGLVAVLREHIGDARRAHIGVSHADALAGQGSPHPFGQRLRSGRSRGIARPVGDQ